MFAVRRSPSARVSTSRFLLVACLLCQCLCVLDCACRVCVRVPLRDCLWCVCAWCCLVFSVRCHADLCCVIFVAPSMCPHSHAYACVLPPSSLVNAACFRALSDACRSTHLILYTCVQAAAPSSKSMAPSSVASPKPTAYTTAPAAPHLASPQLMQPATPPARPATAAAGPLLQVESAASSVRTHCRAAKLVM